MTSGILRLVLPRHRNSQDVIDHLEMQQATWVRGVNWLRKPTLFTLVELDPNALYPQMMKAYKQGFIESFEYKGKDKEGQPFSLRMHNRNWFRKWL